MNGARFSQQRIRALRLTAREHHQAAAIEAGLHHMADALGQIAAVNFAFDINLLRGIQAQHIGGRLHLDDMRAHQRRHVCGIGANVEGGFAILVQHRPARIGPDHHGKPGGLGFFCQFAEFFHHLKLIFG